MYQSNLKTVIIAIFAFALLVAPAVLAVDYEINYLNSMLWSEANAVTASGNYAYATRGYGVSTIDISDPASPTILTNFDIEGGKTTSITIDGTHVFVANGPSGIAILDISNTPTLTLTGELGNIGDVVDVAISGNYAYLASTDSGMVVVDITDRSNPSLITCFNDSAGFDFISIEDTVTMVARSGFSMLLNIADPSAPIVTSTISMGYSLKGLFIQSNAAYVLVDDKLMSYDITDITNPVFADQQFFMSVTTMTSIGDYACVITDMGSYMINISNPLALNEDANFSVHAYEGKVTAVGNLAFLSNDNGIEFIDVTNPLSPTNISSIEMDEAYYSGGYFGNELIVSAGWYGFKVIDISDPNLPTITVEVDSNYFVSYTTRVDSVLLIGHSTGMKILNFTDPANPVEIGEITISGYTRGLAVVGNIVYASNSNGLAVIDITDRTSPVEIGSWTVTSDNAEDVLIDGNYAYVANGYNRGLDIVDISDSTNPVGVGSVNAVGVSRRVDKSGDYIFLANNHTGLHIIDVSNPLSPSIEYTWYDGYDVSDVTIVDTVAYVATDLGLQLLNIVDPLNPVEIGNYVTTGEPWALAVDGDYVYMIERDGLCFFEAFSPAPMGIDDRAIDLLPGQISLHQNYPNPFNPLTTIEYSLSVRSKVTINIFNSLGQRVKTLYDGIKPAGDHQLNWDGHSDHGTQLATGIYFYRLQTDDRIESKKMVLLK